MASKVERQNLPTHLTTSSAIGYKGLKRTYEILANATYSGCRALSGIPLKIMTKFESIFLKERSYSKRDYIIPLSLLGTMILPSRYFMYGWQFFLSELVFQYILINILDQLDLTSGLDEDKRRYLDKLHPFHLCLTTSLVEELFYRGILQNGISYLTKVPSIGLVASSILFGYAHFHSHKQGNYGGAISSGVGGIVFGLMNQEFGIVHSMYLHALWNSFGTILSLSSSKLTSIRNMATRVDHHNLAPNQEYFSVNSERGKIRHLKEGCFHGMKGVGSFFWEKYKSFENVQDYITGKLERTIFTKQSHTWHDYIIPLGLLSSMFITNNFVYGWKSLLADLALHLIVFDLFKKHKINYEKHEKEEKNVSGLHPFHLCITTPIVEECYYRGVLQNGISYLTGSAILGAMSSSLLFGLSHYDSRMGNYGIGLLTGCRGMLFAYLNQHHGIINSIYAHSIWNSVCALAISYSSQKPTAD